MPSHILVNGLGLTYKGTMPAPTPENDLARPASIGVKGGRVTVRKIKLFRDTYYTCKGAAPDVELDPADVDPISPNNPDHKENAFTKLQNTDVYTFYVQPGHFLCLGDNSPQSSDGRTWGLVPQRLLLGKALLVYYPFRRAGRIR